MVKRWLGLMLALVLGVALLTGCRKQTPEEEVKEALEKAEQATAGGSESAGGEMPETLPMPGSKGGQ